MDSSGLKKRLNQRVAIPQLSDITKYHLKYTILLSAVPLVSGLVLLLLLSVFSKLNLYFLETTGMLLDNQLREAYFQQVQIETFSVVGYLLLQVCVTAVASYLVMRWATAPFTSAQRTIETALNKPDELRPASRWSSESPTFDRLIWLFSLRVKSGGENQVKDSVSSYAMNLPFLAKFLLVYGTLSVSTGYVLSIIMDSIYKRIIELAVHLTKSTGGTGHYFLAQRDMLQDATTLTVGVALVCYFFLGLSISRYMATMLYVFSRAVYEDKFPITLRSTDLYTGLAQSMNTAKRRIG